MSFEFQHVIITGGSSGIGKVIALQLSRAGAHITIIARTASRLEMAKSEIEAAQTLSGQKVLALTADVACFLKVTAAIEMAIACPPPGKSL
jgi:3-dehydrosphinganine reductase